MKKEFRLLTCLVFLGFVAHAQNNIYPILSTSVETTCIINCLDADSLPYISHDSTLIHAVLTLQLFEIAGISTIHVKLGTTARGSDLLDKTFTFDVQGNVGNNCTYSRTDETVTLGLGDYLGLTEYFSEVILEKNDHTLTEPVFFNR